MDRKSFRELILKPLEVEFNVKIYFSGKLADSKNLSLRDSTVKGGAFIFRKNKVIVIRWQRSVYNTLQVLFHELSHLCLHGRGNNFRGRLNRCELEAELVAIVVCRKLNINYDHYYSDSENKEITDIEYFNFLSPQMGKPRYQLIADCSAKVIAVMKKFIEENPEILTEKFIEIY